jgi:hypothetical protein
MIKKRNGLFDKVNTAVTGQHDKQHKLGGVQYKN